jgi:hypothetical protein
LAEATLRLSFDSEPEAIKRELGKAFLELFKLYESGSFEVRDIEREKNVPRAVTQPRSRNPPQQTTVTANCILAGSGSKTSLSLYWGQDYSSEGKKSLMMGPVYTVDSMDDVADLPVLFSAADFDRIFHQTFANTKATVRGIVSLVYIVRKMLDSYEKDRVTEGRTHVMLY